VSSEFLWYFHDFNEVSVFWEEVLEEINNGIETEIGGSHRRVSEA